VIKINKKSKLKKALVNINKEKIKMKKIKINLILKKKIEKVKRKK
jgi:hypothetical protein